MSPSATAKQTARHLRLSEKCDLVVAITHMRLIEDLQVSNKTASGDERIDLLLGGHDHNVVRREPDSQDANPEIVHSEHQTSTLNQSFTDQRLRIVKSGTDWRGLSVIKLKVDRSDRTGASIVDMTSKLGPRQERLSTTKIQSISSYSNYGYHKATGIWGDNTLPEDAQDTAQRA